MDPERGFVLKIRGTEIYTPSIATNQSENLLRFLRDSYPPKKRHEVTNLNEILGGEVGTLRKNMFLGLPVYLKIRESNYVKHLKNPFLKTYKSSLVSTHILVQIPQFRQITIFPKPELREFPELRALHSFTKPPFGGDHIPIPISITSITSIPPP